MNEIVTRENIKIEDIIYEVEENKLCWILIWLNYINVKMEQKK